MFKNSLTDESIKKIHLQMNYHLIIFQYLDIINCEVQLRIVNSKDNSNSSVSLKWIDDNILYSIDAQLSVIEGLQMKIKKLFPSLALTAVIAVFITPNVVGGTSRIAKCKIKITFRVGMEDIGGIKTNVYPAFDSGYFSYIG